MPLEGVEGLDRACGFGTRALKGLFGSAAGGLFGFGVWSIINARFRASDLALRSASSMSLTPTDVERVDLSELIRSLYVDAKGVPSSPGVEPPSSSKGNIDSGSLGPGDAPAGLCGCRESSPDRAAGLSARGVARASRAAWNRKSSGVDSRLEGVLVSGRIECPGDSAGSSAIGIAAGAGTDLE
jgi:hypothetical protein